MKNPLVRLKEILGELWRNGRSALALLQEHAARLKALEWQLDRIDPLFVGRADQEIPETGTSNGLSRERILRLAALLEPRRAAGAGKVRVGGGNDGGYVMLDDWSGIAGAISIGIGNDDAWDRAILARGIPVAQFDHTITDPPGRADGLAWQPLGVGAADVNNVRTLASLIRLSGLPEAGDLLLKTDVESAEWAVFAAGEHVAPVGRFRQIVIELHGFDRVAETTWFAMAEAALSHLARTHAVIHVHANNCCGMTLIGGIPFPRLLEVTYARRDAYALEPEHGPFPSPIDAPCIPDKPDIYLGSFQFPPPGAGS
jgi:hypothetical protein